jgi:hypothetical protein
MISALLARLIESGTPAELVAEVAMELARAEAIQEQAERRKAKDRERKRLPRNSEESTETTEFQSKGFPLEVSPQTPLPKTPSKEPPFNPPKFQEAWNEPAKRHGLPTINSITGKRLRSLKQRIADHGEQAVFDAIAAVFKSPHWLGKNDWLGNFDSMLRPDNFVRLTEGAYGPKGEPSTKLTPEETRRNLEKMIPLYERMGKQDEAEECRRRVASLGAITSDLVNRARATQ